jgi:streptogramin lyase
LAFSSFLGGGHRAYFIPGGDRAPTYRRRTRTLLIAIALAALSGGIARAQQIVEFPVPTAASEPLGITAGPDGAVWFTENSGNRIGRITTGGVVSEFPIPTAASSPSRITAGPDGALWFTEFNANKIGRITTQGAITEFDVPTPSSLPLGITAGPDGNIWFTELGGHKIGRISLTGTITEFPIPARGPFPAEPYSIVTGPDGALWFSNGSNGQVGRITTEGVIALFRVDSECCAWLAEIAAGPDGNLWFPETNDNKIGRITPTGEYTYFTGLGPGFYQGGPSTDAYGIASGGDGALWFTEVVSNRIGRITTEGTISEIAIPTARSEPNIITAGPDGALWFTELRANKIGRVSAGEHFPQECRLTSGTLCLNAERFRVNVDWRVPSQGTSGVGTAVQLTGDTGYFWFFSSNNIELAIKVVDGRTFNGHFWVFYGALSDVEYTVTVTDMTTGVTKTYANPQGRLGSVADTAAFVGSGPLRALEPTSSPSNAEVAAVDLARTASELTFTEFPVSDPNSGVNAITNGPDGALWFTETNANKIGRITTTGALTEFPVTGNPFGITSGPDGALWYTTIGGTIGRITVAGAVTGYPLAANSRPNQITRGTDGALWFTDNGRNTIGRITIGGVIAEFPIPTPNTNVWGIAAGPDGNVWFTETMGNPTTQGSRGAVGRITPAGTITEFRSSIPEATPVGIVAGPDGNLWFTEFNANRIGRITPEGLITESQRLPGEIRGVVSLTAGPDGALWFVDDAIPYGKISRITTSWNLSEFDLPSSNVRSLGITTGADGNLWFTDRAGNKIWRVAIGSSPAQCSTGSQNLCLNADRFRVRVDWQVPDQGTSGVGRAVSLTGDTGYFWFFSSNNVELVIKVVDGRTFNGHFWVFYGALSDVEYTITVTDTLTGTTKTYTNPRGQLASVADTAAF